jgi:hypothetical protein
MRMKIGQQNSIQTNVVLWDAKKGVNVNLKKKIIKALQIKVMLCTREINTISIMTGLLLDEFI